jgi:hypothetical protein
MIVPCGCESLFVSLLRERYSLRESEKEVLRQFLNPRKLHNEELHKLYFSPVMFVVIKFKWMRWAGHIVRLNETRDV